MDALKLELNRKRVTSLQQKHTMPNTAAGPKRKYRRRGEIEAEIEAERQQTMQAASALNNNNNDSDNSNDRKTSPSRVPAAAAAAVSSEESRPDLHESEEVPSASAVPAVLLVEKTNKLLRAMMVPIRFFGESDEQQQKRLRRLQIEQHDRDHSASAGAHNVLQRIEEEIESEILKASHQDRERERNTKGHASSGSANSVHKHLEKYRAVKNRDEFEFTEDYVLHFFKRLLLEWEIDLIERLDSVRRSMQGRRETAKQKQTAEYIKPFFKILKNRTVNADILADVGKIVDLAMAREYVKANDWYLRMSIGNAPWPMGVTSVGIHERAARTKIFSNKVAHVLNDENQRKYIQSMKRLLTFAQQKYPNASNTKNVG